MVQTKRLGKVSTTPPFHIQRHIRGSQNTDLAQRKVIKTFTAKRLFTDTSAISKTNINKKFTIIRD